MVRVCQPKKISWLETPTQIFFGSNLPDRTGKRNLLRDKKIMLNRPFTRKIHSNRWFGLLLILALLIAAQHLAMHDIGDAGGGPIGHQECQLNHLPYAQLSPPLLGLPPLVPALLLETVYRQYFPQIFVHPWLARAPPLN